MVVSKFDLFNAGTFTGRVGVGGECFQFQQKAFKLCKVTRFLLVNP